MRHIEYLPIDAIPDAPRNPRIHDTATLDASLGRFGYIEPIVLDERTGRLIAGHGRKQQLIASQLAGDTPPEGVELSDEGRWLVPVVRGWASRDDAEAEAAQIAVNHQGEWEPQGLVAMLDDLSKLDDGLLGIGYTSDDISALLDSLTPAASADDPERDASNDDWTPPTPAVPVSQRGDIWLVGSHRVMCGDARSAEDVDALFDGRCARVAFTSPPYADRRDYDADSGFVPVPAEDYVQWFDPVQSNIARVLDEGGSWFVNIKEHCEDGQRVLYVKELTIAHVRVWGWYFVDELCWVKGSVPGTWPNRFKNGWEPVFHYTRGGAVVFHPLANGHESDAVIRHSPETHIGFTRDGGLVNDGGTLPTPEHGIARPSNVVRIESGGFSGHSAAFPVALPAWFVRAYSDPGDNVFDPFMGSGSTLIAAHVEGRAGLGMELSPAYLDVALARLQRATGVLPARGSSGETHDFLA